MASVGSQPKGPKECIGRELVLDTLTGQDRILLATLGAGKLVVIIF